MDRLLFTSFLAALLVFTASVSGDTITVDGVRRENVYIIKGENMYYVLSPADGKAENVPIASVDPELVVIDDDAARRKAIYDAWKSRRTAHPEAESPPESEARDWETNRAPNTLDPGDPAAYDAFAAREMVKRLAYFEGQLALWSGFTEEDRAQMRQFVSTRSEVTTSENEAQLEEQAQALDSVLDERERIRAEQERRIQRIQQSYEEEQNAVGEIYSDPAFDRGLELYDELTDAQYTSTYLRQYRSAFYNYVARELVEDQLLDSYAGADAAAADVSSEFEARRAAEQDAVAALEGDAQRIERAAAVRERNFINAARVAEGINSRNRSQEARIELLDASLKDDYIPQLQTKVVSRIDGAGSRDTVFPTIGTDLWRITWNIFNRSRGDRFRFNVVRLPEREIVATFGDDRDAFDCVAVLAGPGRFGLEISAHGGLDYHFEIAELR